MILDILKPWNANWLKHKMESQMKKKAQDRKGFDESIAGSQKEKKKRPHLHKKGISWLVGLNLQIFKYLMKNLRIKVDKLLKSNKLKDYKLKKLFQIGWIIFFLKI